MQNGDDNDHLCIAQWKGMWQVVIIVVISTRIAAEMEQVKPRLFSKATGDEGGCR